MVYERVRWIDIPADGGSIVSASNGTISDTYSTNDIDGRITKIWYDSASAGSSTGSLWITVSGTGEQIYYSKGSTNADFYVYPRTSIVDNNGTVGSVLTGQFTEFVMRGENLHVAGSGLGNGKVIGKIRVYYY